MKARVKNSHLGVINIEPCYVSDGKVVYRAEDLEFIDEPRKDTDWQVYRMEVAKECMATMLAKYMEPKTKNSDIEIAAEWSVQAANALIARLKEQKGE